jgi:hypothetical protein
MGGFRRFIIGTAEVMMVIFIVLLTLAVAVSSAVGAQEYGSASAILAFIIGGIIGFVGSAILAAFFFLLAEIAANTRPPHAPHSN